MEEDQYRTLYHELNNQRCCFEKALNSRKTCCAGSRHFMLAGREGYGCDSRQGPQQCQSFLSLVRQKARFALGLTRADQPLPHNKEIKVQVGSVLGLAAACRQTTSPPDIGDLLRTALQQYGSKETLPFDQIIQSIVSYRGRTRSRRPSGE